MQTDDAQIDPAKRHIDKSVVAECKCALARSGSRLTGLSVWRVVENFIAQSKPFLSY
jgi:hypothetical protein